MKDGMLTRFRPEPVTLSGQLVRLEPLTSGHTLALINAARHPDLFRWFPMRLDTPDAMQVFVETALDEQQRGVSLPFATIEPRSGQVIGATRFMNLDRGHLRVEIGSTWLGRTWQRTGINREAKLLMLTHAFEDWQVRRVEFKTHHNNTQSRTALAQLGASEEGTLRKHMVMPDGSARHSVYFSILDEEWAGVKKSIESSLARS